MKNQWIALAAVALGLSLVPSRAAAQGPQGVGAGEAARAANPSYNPMNWMKKKSQTPAEALESNSDLGAKLTAKLRVQGLLPSGADLSGTCETFKDLGDCVATLHASHNLDMNFDCLKSKVTGVQVSDDTSSCSSVTDGKPMGLNKAIHSLKPGVDAKVEANTAERQSRGDLADTTT